MKSNKKELSKEELAILINLVQHEIEWTQEDSFYNCYRKQLEEIKEKLDK